MAILTFVGIVVATLVSTALMTELPETAAECAAAEASQESRDEIVNGLYDIADHDEVSLEVTRLASQPIYESTLGYYLACADGTPLGGQVIWPNAATGTPIEFTIDLHEWPEAEALGFFLIPHGATRNQQIRNRDNVSFAFEDDGWVALHAARPLKGRHAALYTTDPRLNAGGQQQAFVDSSTGTLNWLEQPSDGGVSRFHHLKERVRISAGNTALSPQ